MYSQQKMLVYSEAIFFQVKLFLNLFLMYKDDAT